MDNLGQTVLEKVINSCKIACSSKIPILYLLTDEMELVDDIVKSQELVDLLETKDAKKGLEFLSDTSNWQKAVNYKANVSAFSQLSNVFDTPKIMVVHNYHLYIERDITSNNDKMLNDYVHKYINAKNDSCIKNSVLILASPILKITKGLESYMEVIDVCHLENFEIEEIILDFIKGREEKPVREYLDKLINSFKGFSKSKIKEILKKIIAQSEYLSNNSKTIGYKKQPEEIAFEVIKIEKEQMLKKSGTLSIINTENVTVGGLKGLVDWIRSNKIIFDHLNDAKTYWNVEFSKGVLVSGIPGTGKTLMAKKTAQLLNIPLIKMDMGALLGAYIGESESNMRLALKMAEAMAPCVLWIDELEKGFAGVSNTSSGDSGTVKRMFASFLTWMQDNQRPCFIFATANDISKLPPEFLRKGRFDQKFYVYMPMRIECIEIFKAILKDKNKIQDANYKYLFEPSILEDYFLGDIVDSCVAGGKHKFLTGADIDGIVKDALKAIYIKKYESNIQTSYKISKEEMKNALLKALDETKTYGETNLADIAKCFISLYENKFLPASGDDKDRVLFDFCDFKKEREDAIERTKDSGINLYDGVLFDTIKEEINMQMRQYNGFNSATPNKNN
jgi:SpoVK/Ycf46/Vps4 family AAA+-type ATPase